MRVLAIDPSIRSTGYGLVEDTGNKPRVIDFGEIKNRPTVSLSQCLCVLHQSLVTLIERHQPTVAAIEGIIYVQSYRTAITLGSARGAVLLACGQYQLPIYEYAPRRIKQAVVGRGAAEKQQVAYMVRARLGMTTTPSFDAADALALALTHLQTIQSAVADLKDVVRL